MIDSTSSPQGMEPDARSRRIIRCAVSALVAGSMAIGAPSVASANGTEGENVASAAATGLPFEYTVDFDSNLRGRDMKTTSGNFCNRYRSDLVANPVATPYVRVTLIRNRAGLPDERLESRTFPNDGRRHSSCWPHHDGSSTYHFEYSLPNFGYTVKGHGTVYSRR